jgi:hypothetical protein
MKTRLISSCNPLQESNSPKNNHGYILNTNPVSEPVAKEFMSSLNPAVLHQYPPFPDSVHADYRKQPELQQVMIVETYNTSMQR